MVDLSCLLIRDGNLTTLATRQEEGRCGASFSGTRCSNNQCCSAYGYCGTSFEHCAAIVGCQPEYGRCGDPPAETSTSTSTSTTTSTTTSTPTSTPTSTSTSTSSTSSTSSSSTSTSTSTSTRPPAPTGTLIVSTNGQCGNSTTCSGSGFGNCCSEFYFCGNSIDYCGTGCRLAFGTCGDAPPISSTTTSSSATTTSSSSSSLSSSSSTTIPPTTTSSTPSPTSSTPSPTSSTPSPTSSTPSPTTSSTQAPIPTNVSTDGQCGANGKTCTGSSYGRCCSSYGWCGSQTDYCRVSWGCQAQWGECGELRSMGHR
ncbi:carbohydrate-binding module family 18 protein [Periconia macrospinosa]|uniref:Carbohydrate-binding module family 18 protein n=1 Tax=Periconia macrospinosa TaxID=97972 RepID=A0A2V1DX84_9PLEO|nr:carbohydrate-binding module family 18 protein [Periconia macrospinosa]